MEVLRFFALWAQLRHDSKIVSRTHFRSHAVLRGLVLAALALAAAACGAGRPSARSSGERDAKELAEAVERLRLERRLRERKIRDLENQLSARPSSGEPSSSSASSSSAASSIPNLPVQVLSPSGSRLSEVPSAAPRDPSASRLSESEGEILVNGERIVGVADDGSEIVYIDDAATGRVVSPSAEVLAEVGRTQRRPLRSRSDGPEIDEGDAQALLDAADDDRLPPAPTPLASISRRAARTRVAPTRLPSTSPHLPPAAPVARPRTSTMMMPVAGPLHTGASSSSSSSASPAAPATKKAPPQPTVRGSDEGNAEAHYRASIALVRRAEYPAAIASMREFLQKYPRHDYADNAQYWLGESFYAQQQFEQALVELRRVVEVFPQGNKVPDALLKVGYCHLAMGDREKATGVLREVVRLFPRTQPALLAARKLEEAGQ